MSQLSNPMAILKLLNKSNCGQCKEATCLAFAAAVARGKKRLEECPHLDRDIIEKYGGTTQTQATPDQELDALVEALKRKIAAIDLASAAQRVGAEFRDDNLTLKVCGKNFSIDSAGNPSSEIHTHRWLTIPVLSYILKSPGTPVSGKWVPFRELKGGKTWYRLFGQRCEKPLKNVADAYTDLFHDMLHIFNGRQVEKHYQSDISLVLHPLPKVPILICYWRPEEGLESSLNLFFDATAEDHLSIESLYTLATGLVRMFEKIALRHGS